MTNKQAIEKLNDIRCHVKETSTEEQALVMAIEALKKAGIYGDIIYREDALMCLTGEYPADFKHDELIAKFIRRIRELPPAQPEQRWIPCSEILPEESGYYIVTAHDGTGHRTTFVKYQKKDKSWYLTGARSYWRVIAWMPLPEPYKAEAERRTK